MGGFGRSHFFAWMPSLLAKKGTRVLALWKGHTMANQPLSPVDKINPLQPVFELLQGGDPDAIAARYGLTRKDLEERLNDYQESRRKVALADQLQMKQVGRNDPCPCGSGKKFKKCCLTAYQEARQTLPPDALQEAEEHTRRKEKIQKEVQRGFDLLFSREYEQARRLAERTLESYPDDDRLHDILSMSSIALGDYDRAFFICRERWQVAGEEKNFYQENGYHKREGEQRKNIVFFYSPSTWLDKFWVANRARTYHKEFPPGDEKSVKALAEGLNAANDTKRFPGRQEEGYEARRKTLAPTLEKLETEGNRAVPYLLPLTYVFSWASLFVPDLLARYGGEDCTRLLAELSMFRFPYFSQKCLKNLEGMGNDVVPIIRETLQENPAFDELKTGLLSVLGKVHTPESFDILVSFMEHENPYVVNWAAQALGEHGSPDALPHLEKAKQRLGALSKIAGAIQELASLKR